MALRVANWHELHFPYHTLGDDQVDGRYERVGPQLATPINDPSPSDVGDAPELLRQAGVAEIILVHGTFAGNDIAGVVREIARFSPNLARFLSQLGKQWFDDLAGEVGNYTSQFADRLSSLINPTSQEPIPVRRFHWSGENHHLGRADGVMSLLDSLTSARENTQARLLILAHSHGGNLAAMMSQLLGADACARGAFFEATQLHYSIPLFGKIDLPIWPRVKRRWLGESRPLPPIDVATFGTPLRYRWNASVCPRLLHIVQDRPAISPNPELAAVPRSLRDVIGVTEGDHIQHLGIAGTDFLPSIFAWRDWIVERRMRGMFEPRMRRRDLIKNLKRGRQSSADGTTLLVDYPDCDQQWNRKLFGHGVYTCHQWLPFHLREIANRFYGPESL